MEKPIFILIVSTLVLKIFETIDEKELGSLFKILMSLHCSKCRKKKKKHKVKTLMLKTSKERIIPLSKCLVYNCKKSKLIKIFSKIPMLVDIFFYRVLTH